MNTKNKISREPCSCGRGSIEWEYIDGNKVSRYSIWDGSSNFGELSFCACCVHCKQDQDKQFAYEFPYGY